MLNIYYSYLPLEKEIYNTTIYFRNSYDERWLTTDRGIKMIKDVDKSEVLSPEIIKSPVLGIIDPNRLSGGVKALLLIDNEPDKLFNASMCGDNCARWLVKMGKEKDITVVLHHLMCFEGLDFEIRVLNNDKIYTDYYELIKDVNQYL